ncbi:MAG: TIGR04283 family arsenosugar biosynthesis glycosyltransferase [Thermodesulfobacteriota bacterium]|nr:MAG: TIGR04283 family arsenosugar biosynthesis glycosyltransferase [Thermodesulfobacteriota bacterium]
MKVTVIIPALNEARVIDGAIKCAGPGAEVIVADGGSTDGTRAAARGSGARVIHTGPGRGLQMDSGAREATGDVLLFLHADTVLPQGWKDTVQKALEDELAVGGAFRLSIDSPARWLRVVEFVAGFRARFLKHIYGDQAIFVRRDVFFRVGGFRNLPLMEDVDCVKRLRQSGRFVLLNEQVKTSPRRWVAGGMLKNTLKNWLCLIFYRLGYSPVKLYGWYYRKPLKPRP